MSVRYFCGGRVVLPHNVVTDMAVGVEDGRITAVVPRRNVPTDADTVELDGAYLMPGFVDIHVHGGGGADFMDATPAAMRRVSQLHCAHGTTAMCPTTMTCPHDQLLHCIDVYREVAEKGTGGADFIGLHLEGPYLSGGNTGAQPKGFFAIPTEAALDEIFERAAGHIVRWDAAPELAGMHLFAQKMREHGVLCSIAHSAATAEQTLAAYEQGFTHITHMYCATTTEHKVGQVVHGGIIEATYLEDGITAELIADGKHIPRETMKLVFRMKGDDRLALITDAMRAAGTNVSESILGGGECGVPVIVEDGVAKLPDRTSFAGSIATMDHALRVAHVKYGIPLCDVVRAMTLTPASLVGAEARKGSIQAGKDADLVVMDDTFSIRRVFVRGEERSVDA